MAKIVTLVTAAIFGVMFMSDLAHATDEAAKAAPAATAKTAPAKPANHAGRTTCLGCHEKGVAGAKVIPADHAGRKDADCSGCHKDGK